MTGVELIAAERARQQCVEGYSPQHDQQHTDKELARAAACYLLHDFLYPEAQEAQWQLWPSAWLFKAKDRRSNLVRAGALIAAELDRIGAGNMDHSIDWRSCL